MIKEPYILEFLNVSQHYSYSEKELEQKIIDNLQMFPPEFGKGFSFVARQYRISFENKHFYIDLVFYHRVLKCFVLIDLKIGEVTHLDIGQMNLYLNYFKSEESSKGDNEPIGIILGADKNEVLVKYALGNLSNKLFVSKYTKKKITPYDSAEYKKELSFSGIPEIRPEQRSCEQTLDDSPEWSDFCDKLYLPNKKQLEEKLKRLLE